MKKLRSSYKTLDRLKYSLILVVVSLICYNVCVNHINVKASQLKLMNVLWIHRNMLGNICGPCMSFMTGNQLRRSKNTTTLEDDSSSRVIDPQEETHGLLNEENNNLVETDQEHNDLQLAQEEQKTQEKQEYTLRGESVTYQQVYEAMCTKKKELEDFGKKIRSTLELEKSYEAFPYEKFFVDLWRHGKYTMNSSFQRNKEKEVERINQIPTWLIPISYRKDVPSSMNRTTFYLQRNHELFTINSRLWSKYKQEWHTHMKSLCKYLIRELTIDWFIQILKELEKYDKKQNEPILEPLFDYIESGCKQGYNTRDPDNCDDEYSRFHYLFHQIITTQTSQFINYTLYRINAICHRIRLYMHENASQQIGYESLIGQITQSKQEETYVLSRVHELPLLRRNMTNVDVIIIVKKLIDISSVFRLHKELKLLGKQLMEKDRSGNLILLLSMTTQLTNKIQDKIWLQRACNMLVSRDPNIDNEREEREQRISLERKYHLPIRYEFTSINVFLERDTLEYEVSKR